MRLKTILLGKRGVGGLISKAFIYIILIGISFIYLYPILRMLAMSLMTLEDLNDSQVNWLPNKLNFDNYVRAFNALNFMKSFGNSLLVSILPTIFIIITSSLVGYALARYRFPLRKFVLAMCVVTFVLPTILTAVPNFVLYSDLHLTKTLWAYILPAALGFGLRQSLFILIFFQFFRILPDELFEAAEIDGCGEFGKFFVIGIPLSTTAFLITFLYSFVWYFNETTMTTLYFGSKFTTLAQSLTSFRTVYEQMFNGSNASGLGAESFNQGVLFAGTLLSISPLLIVYAIAQRWFIEGIDKSGLAGQ